MEDDPDTTDQGAPKSLMPYDAWTEEAMRFVVLRALRYVAEHGLPGDHHIYLTFRTDHPGTTIPARLKTQYPQEMTIVLQHQFWDLEVHDGSDGSDGSDGGHISIGLSFGGVPSTLLIPLSAITAFADPHIRFVARFRYVPPGEPFEDVPTEAEAPEAAAPEAPQVVSLDAFRRRTPPRDP